MPGPQQPHHEDIYAILLVTDDFAIKSAQGQHCTGGSLLAMTKFMGQTQVDDLVVSQPQVNGTEMHAGPR